MKLMMNNRMPRTIILLASIAVFSLVGLLAGQGRGQAPAGPAPAAGAPAGPAGAQGAGGRGGGAGGGARGGGGRGAQPAGPPPAAQTTATVDLTGYWVSLVTEDWRWRMKVPDKGDVSSIGPANQAMRDAANVWDPAKDEAEGNQCRSYGAAAIMRVPTRVHISWDNENVMKLETDAGTQTRLLRFGAAVPATAGDRTWQGLSVAEWEPSAAGGRGGGGFGGGGGGARGGVPGGPPPLTAPPTDDIAPLPLAGAPAAGARGAAGGRGGAMNGDLKVVTKNMKAGYLRKNGVPYSEKATVTEYFNRTDETYGNTYMVVTSIVEDPDYLTGPFITSSHFKKLPDTANGWDPTPCSVR